MIMRIDLNLNRKDLSFEMARAEAVSAASRKESDPTLLSWYDHRHNTHSPNYLSGEDNDFIVRDYAEKWGGELEVNVNEDYAFIFLDGSAYEKHDSSPYLNIEDEKGEWYICLSEPDVYSGHPTQHGCSHLNEIGEATRGG